MPLADEKPLESWKEIATYLGRSERTVQRWERKGLPVHRHPALGVIAYRSEIGLWLQTTNSCEQVAGSSLPIERGSELIQPMGSSAVKADVETDRPAMSNCVEAAPTGGLSFSTRLRRYILTGSWIALAAATGGWIESLALRSSVWRYLLAGAMAAVLAVLSIAVAAPAYGLAIAAFMLGAGLLTLIYLGSEGAPLTRALVAIYMIAAMSYIGSASTMSEVQVTVINVTTLSPAKAYLFVMGLEFIPLFVLVLLFWVILGWGGDAGFQTRPALGKSYVVLGILFLLTEFTALAITSGDGRVFRAGLPGRWTLIIGSGIVFVLNLTVWLAGLRCFRKTFIRSYGSLFSVCGTAYLALAFVAFFIDHEHNRLNQYYLDVRRPEAYAVSHPDAIKDLRRLLQGNLRAEVGPYLTSLLNDDDFREVLRTGTFYKQPLDEPFQVFDRAVMFGYKRKVPSSHGRVPFVVIRFPKELADALRFESIGEKK